MILIADSGSTKTSWALVARSGKRQLIQTDGMNPFHLTDEQLTAVVFNQLLPQIGQHLWIGPVTHIFFYGAGCTPAKKGVVASALSRVFPKAEVQVESDLLGAIRALLGDNAGTACILGTGMASCYYDGQHIVQQVPSLGYILDDEGGGAAIGRRLVYQLFKQPAASQAEDSVVQLFCEEEHTSLPDIIEHVYRQPLPNRYLAQFSHFCKRHIDIPSVQQVVTESFQRLFADNLVYYPTRQLHFCGSIAYHFADQLQAVANQQGFTIERIIQAPIEHLAQYHHKKFLDVCNISD